MCQVEELGSSSPVGNQDAAPYSKLSYLHCKFDLLKGYLQVSLTPRAKEITAFVTPTGQYSIRAEKRSCYFSTDDS